MEYYLNWIDDLNQCHVIRIIFELLLNYTRKLSLLYIRNHPYTHPVNRFWEMTISFYPYLLRRYMIVRCTRFRTYL